MTPEQFVSKLAERFPMEVRREFLLTARLIFKLQAEDALELRTISGMRLLDASDWKEFFLEVGDVLAENSSRPRDLRCPDCDHVHEDRSECGHYLGEEKFCRCEAKVAA